MTLEDLYRLLRSGHVQAQGIVDTLREPLVVLDQSFCVLNGNAAFYETFRVERDAVIGQNFFELGNGQWDIAELRDGRGRLAGAQNIGKPAGPGHLLAALHGL